MDFLDPKKKKAYKIRLFVGYFLMAIALGIGSFILLMEAYGYDVNRKTGGVIQNGMVFVGSHPEQSQIYLNGKFEGDTNTRLVLPEADYKLELKRDGYVPWERQFKLRGSSIERMDYAFLIPEKLNPNDAILYSDVPKLATQSPDRNWLLVQRPGKFVEFDVVDLSNSSTPARSVKLAPTLFTETTKKRSLEVVEWSTDNRHVLLRHNYADSYEFVVVDIEDAKNSYNVNKTFKLAISKVLLRDKKWDNLYILESSTENLISAEYKNNSKSVILNDVKEFKPYGKNVLLYVAERPDATDKTKTNIEMRVREDKTDYKIRNLPKAPNYYLDIARYKDKWFVVGSTDSERVAYVYKDVFDSINQRGSALLPAPVAVLRLKQKPTNISFSANTQFIGVQSGNEFSVYDAEHDRQHRYTVKLKIGQNVKARWMDGHRYVVESEGQAYMFDYDGLNMRKLTPANNNYVFFDRDYDFIYTIGKSISVPGKPSLIRTPVRTEPDL